MTAISPYPKPSDPAIPGAELFPELAWLSHVSLSWFVKGEYKFVDLVFHPCIISTSSVYKQRESFRTLPTFGGVYVVTDLNGNVLYVGMARYNIRKRWYGHHKLRQIINMTGYNGFRISCLRNDYFNLTTKRIETNLIRRLRPVLNKTLS